MRGHSSRPSGRQPPGGVPHTGPTVRREPIQLPAAGTRPAWTVPRRTPVSFSFISAREDELLPEHRSTWLRFPQTRVLTTIHGKAINLQRARPWPPEAPGSSPGRLLLAPLTVGGMAALRCTSSGVLREALPASQRLPRLPQSPVEVGMSHTPPQQPPCKSPSISPWAPVAPVAPRLPRSCRGLSPDRLVHPPHSPSPASGRAERRLRDWTNELLAQLFGRKGGLKPAKPVSHTSIFLRGWDGVGGGGENFPERTWP